MKRTIYSLLTLLLMATTSCHDLLELESKTDVTNKWLYGSPEGLERAAAGLYSIDREIAMLEGDNQNAYVVQMLDYSTDLMLFRAGTAASCARLDNLAANNTVIENFWKHHYNVIGKANEIISSAEKLGLDIPQVKMAWGEAKFFRGRAYFELYKRYERLYYNTTATNVDNLERDFKPASKEAIFELIRTDLNDAIETLEWNMPTVATSLQYGRATRATAKHVRAQFAMWENDWTEAISQCEQIFANSATCAMEKKQEDLFLKDADLRSKEVLWSYQFSMNMGGGGSGNPLTGHRLAMNTLPVYHSTSGFVVSAEMGGYGWGRIYPNSYLLSLYDKEKDSRYAKMFTTQFYYNDASKPATYGKLFDLETIKGTSTYVSNFHAASKKYFDQWTNADQPDRRSSFKDLVIYRLGETALMCCEAYFHRDGGASVDALRYYNKTWQRAGNDEEKGPLTLDIILDEYARECNFEGVRWPLLKRLGLLGERVKAHAGDTTSEDPYLNTDYAQARGNFVLGKHELWPIPQSQIDQMGEKNFPQHPSWK